MDKNELKIAGIVLGLTALIVYFAYPKGKKAPKKGFSIPEKAAEKDNEYENAVISIKAYRAAMNDGNDKIALDELNRELLKEYNIRIINRGGLLVASDRAGKEIAKEQV